LSQTFKNFEPNYKAILKFKVLVFPPLVLCHLGRPNHWAPLSLWPCLKASTLLTWFFGPFSAHVLSVVGVSK